MAFVLNDRVKETTTSTGTGTINLAGAETGFETFVAGVGNSNTCYYCIAHQSADEFEVGLGTVTDATPDTLARTTIISSSNSDSAVDFSAGTKDVFCTLPASKAIAVPASGDMTVDVPGSIILDADNNAEVSFQDAGTEIGKIFNSSSDFAFEAGVQDKDMLFRGNDGGSGITALLLDMSDAGAAIFNNSIRVGQSSAANLLVANNGDVVELKAGKDGTDDVDLAFQTQASGGSLSERFIIKADGKLGIGTSTPDTDGYSFAEDLVIMAGASADDGVGITLNSSSRRYGVIAFGDSANDNEGELWYDHTLNSFNMRTANVQRFRLDSSGNALFTGNVTAYGSFSDERLKENIKVIENPIEKIKDLKGVTFNYKKDGSKSTGLIAQDLEKVLPEAVYKTLDIDLNGDSEDEHLAIHYGNTVGLLVEAIKEQQEQIETLTAKVKELENK